MLRYLIPEQEAALATPTPQVLSKSCASTTYSNIILDRPNPPSHILNTFYQTAFSTGELDSTTGPASYDMTDLTRQVLCNLFQDVHEIFLARAASSTSTIGELRSISAVFLQLIADIDTTNSADVNFLLGTWLADAQAWGFNSSQALDPF